MILKIDGLVEVFEKMRGPYQGLSSHVPRQPSSITSGEPGFARSEEPNCRGFTPEVMESWMNPIRHVSQQARTQRFPKKRRLLEHRNPYSNPVRSINMRVLIYRLLLVAERNKLEFGDLLAIISTDVFTE